MKPHMLLLFHFYGRLYVPLRYLILEHLQVLNKNFFFFKNNDKIIFLFRLIVVQYNFYFLSKVYYDNHLLGIN